MDFCSATGSLRRCSSALLVVEAQRKKRHHVHRVSRRTLWQAGVRGARQHLLAQFRRHKRPFAGRQSACRVFCCGPAWPALGLHRQSAAAVTAKQPEPLSENERKVLSCIGPQPLGIEELCVRSGLPTAVLLGTLMKLELSGRVLCMPGKRYVIK